MKQEFYRPTLSAMVVIVIGLAMLAAGFIDLASAIGVAIGASLGLLTSLGASRLLARLRRRSWLSGNPAPLVPRREHLPPDAFVSQYGNKQKGFRERPRWTPEEGGPEREISMQEGEMTLAEMTRLLMGRPPQRSDFIRHYRVARLTESGYEVYRSPQPDQPKHVSVAAPAAIGDAIAEVQAWWANPQRVTLDAIDHCKHARKDG